MLRLRGFCADARRQRILFLFCADFLSIDVFYLIHFIFIIVYCRNAVELSLTLNVGMRSAVFVNSYPLEAILTFLCINRLLSFIAEFNRALEHYHILII